MQKQNYGRDENHHDNGGYDPDSHDTTECPICHAPCGPGSNKTKHIREEHE